MMVEKPASEPSMEDILASIRQIISGDSKDEGHSSSSLNQEDHILDLTELLPEDTHEMANTNQSESPSPYPLQPLTESERVLIEKLMEESEKDNLFTPLAEIREENTTVYHDPPTLFEDTLISEAILTETVQALSPLNKIIQEKPKPVEPCLQGIGTQTLENLVGEALKPLLKEWLEAHLPSLVREIVSEQVEKIVHKR